MTKLNLIDLQILHLGIKGNGRFDETDLENSEMKKLGVGRILDQLASLKEKKLIDINSDGTFSITQNARHIFWDNSIPLWVRILKILEIKSQPIEKISLFLSINEEQIEKEIEKLRKQQMVLMSPLRNQGSLVKMYEILPEGIEELQKAQSESRTINLEGKPNQEILGITIELIREIKEIQHLSQRKKDQIISKLKKVKEMVEPSL